MLCKFCDKPISEGTLCSQCQDFMVMSDRLYEEKMENFADDGSPLGPWREADEDSL